MDAHPGNERTAAREAVATVLIYSDDADVRSRMRLALGRRPAADVPRLRYVECATMPAVIDAVDAGGLDVLVLDGEAQPAGGMGVCRQLKAEIFDCPPVLVVTGRRDDAWLAAWSRADAVVPLPIDGVNLAAATAELLRRQLSRRLPAQPG
jgi:DNA-binding response OmpR family regulator